jgi:HSP90 family molecular chaperone
MILEKQKDAQILTNGDLQESIKMSLDLDSAQFLMQMLSKTLYSDSIGSTVRELASNALDSQRRSGNVLPIVVSFKQNSQANYEFSVEDHGIGLDDDDVANIISMYGKSTKRMELNELGMFGLN